MQYKRKKDLNIIDNIETINNKDTTLDEKLNKYAI
jgi:hypothetical protein